VSEALAASAMAGLAGALAWVSRRARRAPKGLEVEASTPLGPGRFVAVVRAGRRRFVIGSTAQALTTLAELGAEDWPAAASGGAEE
jgi:flagellar biogenesis protein FliO